MHIASEKTQRERERLLASNASHNRGSRTKPKTESSRIIRIQRTTVADYDSTSRREKLLLKEVPKLN